MSSPDFEKKPESGARLHSASRARDAGSRPGPAPAVVDVRKVAGNQGLAALLAQRRAAAEGPPRTETQADGPATAVQDVAVSRVGEGESPGGGGGGGAGRSLAERKAQIEERRKALEERKRAKAQKALSERRIQQAERRAALEERKAGRAAAAKRTAGPVLEAGSNPPIAEAGPGKAAPGPAGPGAAPTMTAAEKLAKWAEFQAKRQTELRQRPDEIPGEDIVAWRIRKERERRTREREEVARRSPEEVEKAKRLELEEMEKVRRANEAGISVPRYYAPTGRGGDMRQVSKEEHEAWLREQEEKETWRRATEERR